ncbi:MAG: hypothetical protein DMF63_11280 [Acidobacteria bacterium]|nr:MAG: hypothetical protein DMF63_11280 [Acidobacteriota bacterium]
MKSYLVRSFAVCLALFATAAVGIAQNDTISAAAGDRFMISAKAGGVNFVEGDVRVAKVAGTNGQLLSRDPLEVGDRLTTGADGKVEILLNPGSFVRLGGNSKFEFKTTSLDDLQLKIDSGSAILEVYAADDFKVTVSTPTAVYSLVQSGVFRIDVSGGESRLRVWKGLASVGQDNFVKPGRAASSSGKDRISLAKFDRDEKDALDIWSKARSKELTRQTASLRPRDVRTSLMRGFLGGRWNFLGSFGLWIFNPYSNGYSFMPFGYGWQSPYGYGYGMGMSWWGDMNFPMSMPQGTGNGGTSSGGGTPQGGGSTAPPVSTALRTDRSPIPPFIRMEQANGGGNGFSNGDRGGSADSGSSYTPSYSSSSSSSSSSGSSSSPAPASTGARDVTGSKP